MYLGLLVIVICIIILVSSITYWKIEVDTDKNKKVFEKEEEAIKPFTANEACFERKLR